MRPHVLDELLAEAAAQPFTGWDFSWLDGRMHVEPLPWDFTEILRELASESPDLLDMGTGGGEWLRSFGRWPKRTVATEAWPPNVAVAAAALRAVGIPVVNDEGAKDNMARDMEPPRGRLPFRTHSLSLISNRHEAFNAREVFRVLRPGGLFVTQQVDDGSFDDFHRMLGLEPPRHDRSWLPLALQQLHDAGLEVERSEHGVERYRFDDIGAIAWYLQAVPGAVPEFTISTYRDVLVSVDARIQQDGPVEVGQTRFWLRARKPERQ